MPSAAMPSFGDSRARSSAILGVAGCGVTGFRVVAHLLRAGYRVAVYDPAGGWKILNGVPATALAVNATCTVEINFLPTSVGAKGGTAHLGLLTFAVMTATIMHAIDTTIPNVALPHMQGSLLATQEQIAWVLTSYIVAAAVMTAPVGWLAARFGKKNILLISMIGFTVASMLCGAATDLTEIVDFTEFFPAHDAHQDFFAKNPTQGYCLAVAVPKVNKVRAGFAQYLSV